MHIEPIHPGYGRDNHPAGLGLGHREDDEPDPAWGDVIGGIWDRLTNPLPR